jgi:phage tail sheath gpL-like
MAQYVANPRVTFNITANDNRVGSDDQRCLIVAQMTSGNATPGALAADIPRSNAAINALFGADSHAAQVARAYRSVNKVTNVDVLPLADNAGGTAAVSTIDWTGTATKDGTYKVTLVSDELHTYQIDVSSGDTAAAVAIKQLAVITADHDQPWISAVAAGTLTNTAVNKGSHANDWLISVAGSVPGLTVTVTAWTGGATNPSLTTLFDPVQTLRYQSVIWPAAYDAIKLRSFLEPRKNVDNDIMDGMGFTYSNKAFGTVKSDALGLNSSEVVIITNEPVVMPRWKGPHLPEAPDAITAKLIAALDLRLEPDVSITSVVATNSPSDQFGGIHTHSLPIFNTPLIGVGPPLTGTGYTLEEQRELESSGVSVLGINRQYNSAIMGVGVTTWLNDVAGNSDNTWKFVEWRRTHGAIREYFQRNCQKQFRQHRLTVGTAVAGYAMADESSIRAFILLLYQELAQIAITVEGNEARTFFDKHLSVVIAAGKRQAKINARVPMMSQLGAIEGSLEYSFETA